MHEWNLSDQYLNTWALVAQAFEAAYRAVEARLGEHQITLSQFRILLILDVAAEPPTPGQIARYIFREAHSTSALISRMARAGYVRKTRCRDDDRKVEVRITPKGRQLLQQCRRDGIEYPVSLLSRCLSEEQLEQFNQQLRKIRDCALQDLGRQLEPPPSIDSQELAIV